MTDTRAGSARPGGGASADAADMAGDRVFAALASPVRREVLRLLCEEGPQPVQRIAGRFDMARPSLSEHLRVLREAGLVSERKVGRQRLYRLEAVPLHEVREWLNPFERFWREKLTGLRDLLDDLDES
ncbi:ArsR/SmtB family transcription factor [Streptosporangium sandarakinum]|uniref:DNA-binding transcriptional ArsR family regulator n=1 Tax=Streptosporangium sandarakinum TaxID=1260955 RepID=A0A852URQ6_9ACTN|nr:metalloregulator ArsR/SmtB family transcription factor [Streptosporangium sandarakinum]NYF38096.1 DNA-binding transcriptional ArsR family regulator [Streptosporangium sandarakinum]